MGLCYEPAFIDDFCYLYQETIRKPWPFGKTTIEAKKLLFLCRNCKEHLISFVAPPENAGQATTYYYQAKKGSNSLQFQILRRGNWEILSPFVVLADETSPLNNNQLPEGMINQLAEKLGIALPPKFIPGRPLSEKPFFLWVNTEKLEF